MHGAIEPSAPQRWQTAYRRGPRSRPVMARFRSAVRTSCGGRSNKRARSEEEPVELQRFISDPYPFAITVKLGATKQGEIVYAAQPSEDLVCGICLRNVMVGPTHLSSCQSGHSFCNVRVFCLYVCLCLCDGTNLIELLHPGLYRPVRAAGRRNVDKLAACQLVGS